MTIEVREVKSFPKEFSEGGITYKRTPGTQTVYDNALDRARNLVVIEHGRADAIILMTEAPPPDLYAFGVYLSRNEDNKLVGEESEHIRYEISPAARRSHVRCMYDARQRGIRDMSAHTPPYLLPIENRTLTAEDISPDHDIIGFDHPRTDIRVKKTKAGKTIRTGGNTPPDRVMLSGIATKVLNENFTKAEVRSMNLYFEGSPGVQNINVAGTCSTHRGVGEPVSTISVPSSEVCEGIVTHEIVHALRAIDGRRNTDRDLEEIDTEYETALRVQNPHEWRGGYYQFIPGAMQEHGVPDRPSVEAAVLADRVLATGATDKPLKGRRLTHKIVPKTVRRSRIETARSALDFDTFLHGPRTAEHYGLRQMIAEDVDVYFQIKLPDKSTVEYHIRFDEARPSLAKIKKHLKERFGKNIEAWEWEDGKRVRLISRRKKRTTTKKRTAKKPTTRKTPSKRRIPMTKTPNQYPKGIPPIPGGFL